MRSWALKITFHVALGVALLGHAQEPLLHVQDISPITEELLRYHVEQRHFSQLLMQRALKNFLEQFDAEKIYFLQTEVAHYVDIPSVAVAAGAAQFRSGDFHLYEREAELIQKAITRAREIRSEIEKELILHGENLPDEKRESYLRYASSEKGLRKRIERQLLSFLRHVEADEKTTLRTPEQRNKAFVLLEKRFARQEMPYISEERAEREYYLVLHILKAVAHSLDAHSAFFSPEEAFDLRARLEKQFEGIGVVLKEGMEGVVVADLIVGGPAERSGQIAIGDLLVNIDARELSDLSYDEVLRRMQGDGRSKKISLAFERREGSGKPRRFHLTLQREKILLQDERLQMRAVPCGDGIIGILTLPAFYESASAPSCEADLRAALLQLKQKGNLRGLVLDLRENLGGFLSQAVKVAGLFVTNGVIVVSKYAGGEMRYLRAIDGRLYYDGPFTILTSKASASAAEIVAQALQDYGSVLVVGDPHTYGKGSIQYQNVTDLDAKAFFKVTVGRYYTVSGRSTQIEGVSADIIVPTRYASYEIGERFLNYPLSADQIASVYVDPLSDTEGATKRWLQQNYLPYLQAPRSLWRKMIPQLQANSTYRQQHEPEFKAFLKKLQSAADAPLPQGGDDLQMDEVVKILQDMITLQTSS